MSSEQRDAAFTMLKSVHDIVKAEYYDPRFRGVDIDARYKTAKEKLADVATLSESYGLAAWFLEPLNDSHTVFIPPARPYRIENGWRMKFIGDNCYLIAVEPGSDAAAQGLKPGQQLIGLEGFRMERDSAWKVQYAFETLAPRSAMHLVIADSNGGAGRELLVKANVKKLPKVINLEFDWRDKDELRIRRSQVIEFGDELMIWKYPAFEPDDRELDRFIAKASEHRALILDLRGNLGGAEPALAHLLGGMVAQDTLIGEHIARKDKRPLVAKAQSAKKRFSGKLIVLIDSDSASAAEIFARAIQIEKRGTVLGDRSSVRVMEAMIFGDQGGSSQQHFRIPFAVEVTVSDLIMPDGKSLEHTGVTPDETILPTPEDLATGRDPVLSRAAELAGVTLTPEKAGALFPIIWHSFND